ncbi:MAG: pyridoxamine 5'-phosphate oxidase family protein [Candidatus Omnitrophica bacterium]|nr:pyridoxamine 5'-phosphate oxidase family protein [Candidatus Omnitrophota bacterium]
MNQKNKLSSAIMNFLHRQGFVIVSTLDAEKRIHCSAKGIAGIEKEGKIYLIDLYLARTFENLRRDPTVTITAVDEHLFTGYTLKGKAQIVAQEKIAGHIVKSWEEKVVKRVSTRVIKNIRKDTQGTHHPEAQFAHPKYLIVMDVEEVIDLTPAHLKKPFKEK